MTGPNEKLISTRSERLFDLLPKGAPQAQPQEMHGNKPGDRRQIIEPLPSQNAPGFRIEPSSHVLGSLLGRFDQ